MIENKVHELFSVIVILKIFELFKVECIQTFPHH
jgi:hypothetical protein